MKGIVKMECTPLGIQTTCKLEGVSIADKAHLFHCLKRALEVDALEWRFISGCMEFLERVDDEDAPDVVDRATKELLKELLGDLS